VESLPDRFAGPGPLVHPEKVLRFPVAPVCPACLSFDFEWHEIAPFGTVPAAIEIGRALGNPRWAEATPFRGGLVDMEAGVRLPGRIFCDCGAAAHHGTPVTAVVIQTVSETPIYGFVHACVAGGAD
jgi:uncharacterized OB-fold protein